MMFSSSTTCSCISFHSTTRHNHHNPGHFPLPHPDHPIGTSHSHVLPHNTRLTTITPHHKLPSLQLPPDPPFTTLPPPKTNTQVNANLVLRSAKPPQSSVWSTHKSNTTKVQFLPRIKWSASPRPGSMTSFTALCCKRPPLTLHSLVSWQLALITPCVKPPMLMLQSSTRVVLSRIWWQSSQKSHQVSIWMKTSKWFESFYFLSPFFCFYLTFKNCVFFCCCCFIAPPHKSRATQEKTQTTKTQQINTHRVASHTNHILFFCRPCTRNEEFSNKHQQKQWHPTHTHTLSGREIILYTQRLLLSVCPPLHIHSVTSFFISCQHTKPKKI